MITWHDSSQRPAEDGVTCLIATTFPGLEGEWHLASEIAMWRQRQDCWEGEQTGWRWAIGQSFRWAYESDVLEGIAPSDIQAAADIDTQVANATVAELADARAELERLREQNEAGSEVLASFARVLVAFLANDGARVAELLADVAKEHVRVIPSASFTPPTTH